MLIESSGRLHWSVRWRSAELEELSELSEHHRVKCSFVQQPHPAISSPSAPLCLCLSVVRLFFFILHFLFVLIYWLIWSFFFSPLISFFVSPYLFRCRMFLLVGNYHNRWHLHRNILKACSALKWQFFFYVREVEWTVTCLYKSPCHSHFEHASLNDLW